MHGSAGWRRSMAECVRVAKVETIRPPMTARPSGADCRSAFAEADRHGHHAEDHGRGRHQHRAQTAAGAFLRGFEQRRSFAPCERSAKVTSRIELATAIPIAMIAPMND